MNANTPLPREMYAHKKFHIYFEGVDGLTAGEKLCSRPCFRKNYRKQTFLQGAGVLYDKLLRGFPDLLSNIIMTKKKFIYK